MRKLYYSDADVINMLEKAKEMGLFLGKESFLEQCTLEELDIIVNKKVI